MEGQVSFAGWGPHQGHRQASRSERVSRPAEQPSQFGSLPTLLGSRNK